MKTVPKTVMLGGHKIAVKRAKGLGSMGFNGQANWDAKEIRLDAGIHGTELGEVFIHECVHMVSAGFDLGLDEPTVRALGIGLQQLLGTNPK